MLIENVSVKDGQVYHYPENHEADGLMNVLPANYMYSRDLTLSILCAEPIDLSAYTQVSSQTIDSYHTVSPDVLFNSVGCIIASTKVPTTVFWTVWINICPAITPNVPAPNIPA